jgi:hypothetical protein
MDVLPTDMIKQHVLFLSVKIHRACYLSHMYHHHMYSHVQSCDFRLSKLL